jgi:hypothetical protein
MTPSRSDTSAGFGTLRTALIGSATEPCLQVRSGGSHRCVRATVNQDVIAAHLAGVSVRVAA